MALVLADRVRDTTTTTGTGTVTLSGTAVVGYQTFGAGVGNGNETYYTIAGQGTTEWEVGIGTYSSTGPTLTRDTVLSSSNAGALVPFSAGTKDVFVTQPSERFTSYSGLIENNASINDNYTISTGNNAMSAGPVTVAAGKTVTVPTGSTWTVV